LKSGILVPAHDLEELVAGEHQLGNRRHQVIEGAHIDPDRMVGDPVSAFVVGPLRRGLVGRLAGLRLFDRFARGRPGRRFYLLGHAAEMLDQIAVAAFRLVLPGFDLVEDDLDAVDGGENEGDRLGGDRHAVAELAHQRFGCVRQRFEPGQSEKPARALDGVDEAKDVAEDIGVIRLALEAHQLGVDPRETLAGLGQKLAQQVVHAQAPLSPSAALRIAHTLGVLMPQSARGARLGRQARRA